MTEVADRAAPSPGAGLQTVFLTFLVADIRGYTHYTSEHGDSAGAELSERFIGVMRQGVEKRGGRIFGTAGDQVLAAFESPTDAIWAAIELRQPLREADMQVGMGLAAGDAVPIGDDFRGGVVNMAARLCARAGQGEIYANDVLVGKAQKLEGLAYVERGRILLKGFPDPVRVIQILPENELPAGFPPLVSLVAKPSNLPLQSTPFVGRQREVEDAVALLRRPDVRLLTLTGPGGTGKTRLALQVGSTLLDDFERGVFFVPLATVTDPTLVAPTIAATLRVKEAAGQPLLETLKEYLHDRQMLLVLDNFEQVVAGAPVVAELLGAAPELKVLATSRASLHLTGEYDYAVPPLTLPDLRKLPGLDELLGYDAIALFVQRAQAAKLDFELSVENARAVAEICAAVDGLPLAIELAAARVKIFPPEMLLRRLSRRLNLLTGGARDLPTRQQTLQATIDWSYTLLDKEEQTLFARLSVFAGGCTPAAAQAVCDVEGQLGPRLIDEAESLVDKSLLREEGDEDKRLQMLETIREYALQRLEVSGEAATIRERHARHYLTLAEQAEPAFRGADQDVWLHRLETEHDNMRAALGWALDQKEDDVALRLGAALHWFWQVHGDLSEGRKWLDQTLQRASAIRTSHQVKALIGAGWLALYQYDLAGARGFLGQGLTLARQLADDESTAAALYALGYGARLEGNYEEAQRLIEDSLDLSLALNDTWGIAAATNELGVLAISRGDYVEARERYEESLSLASHLGQRRVVGVQLFNLGYVAWCQADFQHARELYEEALEIFRDVGDKLMAAMTLGELGVVLQLQGDPDGATSLLSESLELHRELDNKLGLAEWLENEAKVASYRNEAERAARLYGAASALRDALGAPLWPSDKAVHERDLAAARTALGDRWNALVEEGKSTPAEQAVEYALEVTRDGSAQAEAART